MLKKRNRGIGFLYLKVQNFGTESKIAKMKISPEKYRSRFEQTEERIRKIEDKVLIGEEE